MFSCRICEIFKRTIFYRIDRVAASEADFWVVKIIQFYVEVVSPVSKLRLSILQIFSLTNSQLHPS